MKKLRNFKCSTGNVFERFVIDSITTVKCNCGEEAVKTLSSPKVIGNTTGRSPSFSNIKKP